MAGIKRNYKNDYQARAARVQLDYAASTKSEETGSFNVWFSKWSGEGTKFSRNMKASEHRCVIERDAGRTRASPRQPFCIHFAHGKCTRGANCTFLHRLPMVGDKIETTVDCFGRDKHRGDRDDMGGIGSFERRCQTLYVGNVTMNDHMEEIIRAHFGEWGDIEYVNILPDKGVAFVQYSSILNAEFAKEAMLNQKLESEDIINVRWAVEDPNPGVRAANKRKAEREVMETVKAQLPIIGDRGTIMDYQNAYKSALSVPIPTFGDKRQKLGDVNNSSEAFAGGDLDVWEAYCHQYFEHYGRYPTAADAAKEGGGIVVVEEKVAEKKKVVADYDSDSD